MTKAAAVRWSLHTVSAVRVAHHNNNIIDIPIRCRIMYIGTAEGRKHDKYFGSDEETRVGRGKE